MAVTAKQIAQQLNLSPAAVSMALNGRPGVSTGTRRRVLEAARALRHNGLSAGASVVHRLSPSVDGAYRDMLLLLEKGVTPARCYFADNDVIAIGAMRALKEKGYRIPRDVAVIGFDNIAFCSYVEPPLTTVNVPNGYMGRLVYAQDLYVVTAACLMVRREVYDQVNGLDESFAVAFNDVDFCVRVRKAGYQNVFTPFAQLYHYESKSRGLDEAPEKRKRYLSEVERFQTRWKAELAEGDPCMNPNFDISREDFGLKILPLE